MFAKKPPRTQREQVDGLLYLGIVHLIQNVVTRKIIEEARSKDRNKEKLGLKADETRSFLKLQQG